MGLGRLVIRTQGCRPGLSTFAPLVRTDTSVTCPTLNHTRVNLSWFSADPAGLRQNSPLFFGNLPWVSKNLPMDFQNPPAVFGNPPAVFQNPSTDFQNLPTVFQNLPTVFGNLPTDSESPPPVFAGMPLVSPLVPTKLGSEAKQVQADRTRPARRVISSTALRVPGFVSRRTPAITDVAAEKLAIRKRPIRDFGASHCSADVVRRTRP